jgi:hypothetical protein
MVPQYSQDDFIIVTDENGSGCALPAEYYSPSEHSKEATIEPVTDKWFYRLSAPGYLDCTEWTGPFDTIGEAKSDLVECYDVHPETGEPLPE